MTHIEKPSTLIFGGVCSKGERTSELFVSNERHANAEGLICLNCPLPANKCKPNRCKRYEEEKSKLKNGGK